MQSAGGNDFTFLFNSYKSNPMLLHLSVNCYITLEFTNPVSLQVAWIAFDKSAILTVEDHVITRNPRVNVSHDGHRTWTLHLTKVNASDAGTYMCQVNTIVAKSQFGIIKVVGE